MYYPTIQNVESIINKLNLQYDADIMITNRGQLEFVLAKPKEKFGGNEMYPKLYQKAAILMETMTKLHPLIDGNKRTAMLTAEFMIKANDGDMVLPLKAIRMSVDVAMDKDDIMKNEIQKWFKVHVAMNPYELSIMLNEHIEEEAIIKNLLKSGKIQYAKELLSRWLAFNNYPEHKKEWDELEKRWKQKNLYMLNLTENEKSDIWPRIWEFITNIVNHPYHEISEKLIPEINDIENLLYDGHSIEDLDKINIELIKNVKILKAGKNHDDIHRAGHLLQHFDRPKNSIEIFKKLCDVNDYKIDAMFHIGIILHQACNDPHGSMKYWDEIRNLEPNNIPMLLYRGHALSDLGKYVEAITCYDKILKETPYHIDALFGKGRILSMMGKYEKALAVFDKGLKIDKNQSDFHNMRGIILSVLGREDSIDAYNKAIELLPDNLGYIYNKAMLLNKLEKYDEAIKTYEKILKINPNHLESLINLGGLLTNCGKQNVALGYLEKAIKLNPDHPVALYNMGITFIILKQYEKALLYFEKMLQNNLDVGNAYFGIAAVYAKQKKIVESLNALKNYLKIDPAYKENVKNDEFFTNVKESELFKKLTDSK